MKNFLFICGPNGIGKTTICKAVLKKLSNSAYVDSDLCRLMNPFVLSDDTIPTIRRNISSIIKNYFDCPVVQTVIFSYGFHGRRKEVFNGLIKDLEDYEYNFIPFLLFCNEEENVRRMKCDERDEDRIRHALESSRSAFSSIDYPVIDISALSVNEAASKIIEMSLLS